MMLGSKFLKISMLCLQNKVDTTKDKSAIFAVNYNFLTMWNNLNFGDFDFDEDNKPWEGDS